MRGARDASDIKDKFPRGYFARGGGYQYQIQLSIWVPNKILKQW